jgi:hypothetical protein
MNQELAIQKIRSLFIHKDLRTIANPHVNYGQSPIKSTPHLILKILALKNPNNRPKHEPLIKDVLSK